MLVKSLPSILIHRMVSKPMKNLLCRHWDLAQAHKHDLCIEQKVGDRQKPGLLNQEFHPIHRADKDYEKLESLYQLINIDRIIEETDKTTDYIDNSKNDLLLKNRLYCLLFFNVLNIYTNNSHANYVSNQRLIVSL